MNVNSSTQSPPSLQTQTKQCRKCGTEKPLTAFQRRKESSDGLGPRCKPCVSLQRKSWRQETVYEGPEMDLTADQREKMYTEVIARMYSLGIMSGPTAQECFRRVTRGG